MAVGFGVSTADQVRQVVSVADAAIVGSALVDRVARAAEAGGSRQAVAEGQTMIRELAAGLATASPGVSGTTA
jgi:tryptophan synthase alpha chain